VIDPERGKKYLVNGRLETDKGIVPTDKLGRVYVRGKKYIVLDPWFVDFWDAKKRGPQAMLKKDIGLIIAYTGVGPGWRVAELGCGSGSLLLYLANLVRPSGKVYAYDKNELYLNIARQNICQARLEEFVEFKQRDLYEQDIDEAGLDLVVLDLPEPWRVVPRLRNKLKQGAFLVAFVLHMEKLRKLHDCLLEHGFDDIQMLECIERKIIVTNNGTRPEISGILHTGYVVISRLVEP